MSRPAPRRRVTLFAGLNRWVLGGLRAAEAIHQGVWLGLLDAQDLDRVTERWYDRAMQYEDRGYNTAGLWGWEEDVLDRYFQGRRRLLVGSAGGGREVLGLCRRGFDVLAFDCSPKLVGDCSRFLASEGVEAQVLVAPPDGVPEGIGQFEGAIVGWGGYKHIPGRDCRVAVLRAYRAHASPGAPILVSFPSRKSNPKPMQWICRTGNLVRRMHGGRVVELGDTLSGPFDHYFDEGEIRGELADAGYELVEYSDVGYAWAVGRAVGD
jgi:hypothetical protein